MATNVIDLSSDKNISNASPIAMIAFMVSFLGINILMDFGLMYFIVTAIDFILCQIFFQFTPRMVFLSLKFYFTNSDLTPTISDKEYFADEYALLNLKKILKDKPLSDSEIENEYLKMLNLEKIEVKNESK